MPAWVWLGATMASAFLLAGRRWYVWAPGLFLVLFSFLQAIIAAQPMMAKYKPPGFIQAFTGMMVSKKPVKTCD